jgi:hypothetical protein
MLSPILATPKCEMRSHGSPTHGHSPGFCGKVGPKEGGQVAVLEPFRGSSHWENKEEIHHVSPVCVVPKESGPLIKERSQSSIQGTRGTIKHRHGFGYRDFKRQGVSPPLH